MRVQARLPITCAWRGGKSRDGHVGLVRPATGGKLEPASGRSRGAAPTSLRLPLASNPFAQARLLPFVFSPPLRPREGGRERRARGPRWRRRVRKRRTARRLLRRRPRGGSSGGGCGQGGGRRGGGGGERRGGRFSTASSRHGQSESPRPASRSEWLPPEEKSGPSSRPAGAPKQPGSGEAVNRQGGVPSGPGRRGGGFSPKAGLRGSFYLLPGLPQPLCMPPERPAGFAASPGNRKRQLGLGEGEKNPDPNRISIYLYTYSLIYIK